MENHQDLTQLLLACEQEPIHIPGAIQPFGVLLSVAEPALTIQNASINSRAAFGIDAPALIGRSFAEFVVAHELYELQRYLLQEDIRERTPIKLTLQLPSDTACQRWELSAHRHVGCLILELEPICEHNADVVDFQRRIRDAVQALQSSGTLQQLCEAAVKQVRLMTGFDRVMLYEFDNEWHGKVTAEACAPHMTSYFHHHFPASDIPAQARAVFLDNWLRMIPDVSYSPAALYPGINPRNGAPLDLGHATLRSVSPIHLEYLRNMQVQATLTISLISEGRLWGLIACHHTSARMVDTDSRLGAKMIGQLVSSQIQLKQSLDDLHYCNHLRGVQAKLLSYMEDEENLALGLVRHSPNMLQLAGASAAAIYYNDKWSTVGKTPPLEEIEQLVDWLVAEHGSETVFSTDRLGRLYPSAKKYKGTASGLVAVSIPKAGRNYVLWFRPEVVTTVLWAGNPDKSLHQNDGEARLHPRRSFTSWQETVEGVAEPWKKVEIEAIKELRNNILALDLQREFIKEQVARTKAEHLSLEKENMVHVLSHDLRTPLGTVKIAFEMLLQVKNLSPEMSHKVLDRGLRAANAIERLAQGVLDTAKEEASKAEKTHALVNANDLVKDFVDLVSPLAEKKSIQLQAQPHAVDTHINCVRVRIEQVLGNLISNALKFTPVGGSVTVSVGLKEERLLFCVADTGVGVPTEHLERIFERFWQEDHARERGTGLGLAIAKEIVEQHGGRIWARSILGKGSSFFFDIPKAN
jgi:light-regulated signal transduction histidine kinase (bacteriophytochrome)